MNELQIFKSPEFGQVRTVTIGGTQKVPIINESGLYSLVLSSKLPTSSYD